MAARKTFAAPSTSQQAGELRIAQRIVLQGGVEGYGYFNGRQDCFINVTGSGGGSVGTVTSVGITTTTLSVSGSPITNSGNITVNLSTTAVTPGSYTNADIIVDAYGRITAAANGSGGGGTPGGSSGQIQYNNAGAFGGFTMGGDATVDTSTGVLTLANTAVTPGTYGDATNVASFTVDSKGRLTFAGNVAITFPPDVFPDVEDDGVSIETDVSVFNFTGAGVTVTSPSAGQVDINIPGGGGSAYWYVPASTGVEPLVIMSTGTGQVALIPWTP